MPHAHGLTSGTIGIVKDRLFRLMVQLSLLVFLALLVIWGSLYFALAGRPGGPELQSIDWLAIAVTGILPLIWVASVARSRLAEVKARERLGKGICPNCGYDLRATPNRCPECGTIAKLDRTASNH